jgi:hypothetical protein
VYSSYTLLKALYTKKDLGDLNHGMLPDIRRNATLRISPHQGTLHVERKPLAPICYKLKGKNKSRNPNRPE